MSERTTKIICKLDQNRMNTGADTVTNLSLIGLQRLRQQMKCLFDTIVTQRLLLGDEAKRTTESGVKHQGLLPAQHLQCSNEIAFCQLFHREQVEGAVLKARCSHVVSKGYITD